MPKNLPTAAELWEGNVSFFSIDTDLIQAAGFNFTEGALHQLPRQLPASMGLQLTEVVVNEIVNHRMQPVHEAIQQFKSASDKLKRLAASNLAAIDESFRDLDVVTAAAIRFQEQIRNYAVLCRGGVLPIAGANAVSDLFQAYFAEKPPFAKRKDKKSEFPDAMSLWLLERYARDNNTKGIVASKDDGWREYADASDHLYCVKSIEDLADLFAATGEHADAIKEKIAATVDDAGSALRTKLSASLNRHVSESEWDASEIYSGWGRVEPEFSGAQVVDYSINGDLNIWPVQGEPTTWVVELNASVTVNIHLSVKFFMWDSIDREELSMGYEHVTTQEEIEVEVFLTCADVHLDTSPNDWPIDIEIAEGAYSIEGFEVERDYGDQ